MITVCSIHKTRSRAFIENSCTQVDLKALHLQDQGTEELKSPASASNLPAFSELAPSPVGAASCS